MPTRSLASFETRIEAAIEDGVIPGVVLLAKDKSGKLNYSRAFGNASIDPDDPRPMRLDTIFAIASMTKLLTAVAILQLIERGKLSLEADVAVYLPELAEQPVLAEGSSAPSPRAKPITVRHLLTHTSGFGYANLAPRLDEWFRATGLNPDAGSTVAARFGHPLVFEPGTSWTYGAGMDWAGKLVEAVSRLDLDSYLQANIFEPLGVATGGVTFFPSRFEKDGIPERMAGINHRDEWTGRVEHTGYWEETDEAFGGEGAYADLTAYFKVLESLLWDDERLLGKATAALLFQGLIKEPEAKAALNQSTRDGSWIVGYIPSTGEYDWSAGGLLVDGDSHPWRNRGMVMWSGRFNSFWFIDRTAGLAAIFGTSVRPAGDPLVRVLIKTFEEEMFAQAASFAT